MGFFLSVHARDILLVMQSAFPAEVSKGSDANLKYAIESLDAAAQYNPWWVTRGEGDSKPKDDRAKVAQYYAQAIKRIEDTVKAINR